MGNPDLSLKSGFRFGNQTRNAKRISPSPPAKSFTKSWLYGCPLYRCSWKSVDNVFFFCLLCVRVRDTCSLKNSSYLFSNPRSPHPPSPPPCLKKNINSKFKKFKKRKKGKPMTGLSALKSVLRFRVVRFQFQKSKSKFPNRIRRPFYL